MFAHCAITMRSDVDRVLTGQIQDNSPWEVHKLVHSDDDDELQKSCGSMVEMKQARVEKVNIHFFSRVF